MLRLPKGAESAPPAARGLAGKHACGTTGITGGRSRDALTEGSPDRAGATAEQHFAAAPKGSRIGVPRRAGATAEQRFAAAPKGSRIGVPRPRGGLQQSSPLLRLPKGAESAPPAARGLAGKHACGTTGITGGRSRDALTEGSPDRAGACGRAALCRGSQREQDRRPPAARGLTGKHACGTTGITGEGAACGGPQAEEGAAPALKVLRTGTRSPGAFTDRHISDKKEPQSRSVPERSSPRRASAHTTPTKKHRKADGYREGTQALRCFCHAAFRTRNKTRVFVREDFKPVIRCSFPRTEQRRDRSAQSAASCRRGRMPPKERFSADSVRAGKIAATRRRAKKDRRESIPLRSCAASL